MGGRAGSTGNLTLVRLSSALRDRVKLSMPSLRGGVLSTTSSQGAQQRGICSSPRSIMRVSSLPAVLLFAAACTVGPRYSRPSVPTPPAYKETPENWKLAQPDDQALKGNWWEIYQQPELNALEGKIAVSNQSLKAAQAQFLQARAIVRQYRSQYYPTASVGASASRNRLSKNRPLLGATTDYTDLTLPVDVSYELDVWGRVRRTVEAAHAQEQATAADVQSVSLSLHAELAMDYFAARALDAETQLLHSTVTAYERALQLTENRYHGGVASQVDVTQAQTQLESTRAQVLDLGVQRAQYEHAIAALIGEPASDFALPPAPLLATPPVIPPGLPSQLLERRPDIASSERRIAYANAQIGIARTAYFPSLTLNASGGFEGSTITNWLTGPSGFAAAGLSAVELAFDGGRRRAVSDQARAAYDQAVADYRGNVLTAFEEVEDNLAALRILDQEASTQNAAVSAAEHSLSLSNNRYRGGVANYLEVITAQSAALTDERAAVQIAGRRMVDSVLLIKALGGGWSISSLPPSQSGVNRRPPHGDE